jgi:hypothetical protein
VFAGGVQYLQEREQRFISRERPDPMAPRHPHDPAWVLDLLFGATEPVRVLSEDASDGLRLAARCEFELANDRCPYGLRRPTTSGSDSSWSSVDVEAYLDARDQPIRVDNRYGDPRDRDTFWMTTELWDFGVKVDIPPEVPAEAISGRP